MANISHSLKKALLTDLKSGGKPDYYCVAAIFLVAAIPAGYAVSNTALGIFAAIALAGVKKQRIKFNIAFLLPVLLFCLMCASLFWSINAVHSAKSISKYLPLVIIPVCFMLNPPDKRQVETVVKYFSLSMFGYGIFYLARALVRYCMTADSSVFFYHELTTKDVNAVHVSLYMALAFFYYLSRPVKTAAGYIVAAFLAFLIILLSSKSLMVTTFSLTIIHFIFLSGYKKQIKALVTVICIFLLAGVIAAVPKIRERFIIETRTIFTDNTVNTTIGHKDAKVYNVSLDEALNAHRFSQNDYFPGMALRAFQVRIFIEMAAEDGIWLTGYGLNAAQDKIKQKVNNYNLYPGYGDFNFHNQYVQNFAELGIAGLLILLVILGINLKNAICRKDFIHISLAILLITLFLTESLLARQRGILFFTVFYCLFNVIKERNQPETNKL